MGLGIDSERGGEQLLHLARRLAGARRAAAIMQPRTHRRRAREGLPGSDRVAARSCLLALLLVRFRDWLWEHVVRETCTQDARLRLFFTTFDTFASAIAGIVKDGVLERGLEVINDRDLCEWLRAHGAKEVTLGATPAERAPVLRAIYDLAFAYPAISRRRTRPPGRRSTTSCACSLHTADPCFSRCEPGWAIRSWRRSMRC